VKFLTLLKARENQAEAGAPPAELFEALGKLGAEAMAAGVLVDTGGIAPSALGAKVTLSGGEVTVTDGPFTEAKELVASYALYDVSSKEEVVEWTRRFLDVHNELWTGWEASAEILQVFGPEDFTPPQG
jgi:hypothetical protein